MYLGFALAAYSVVGNDVIQTLGTFLSSNAKRPWWVLWLFAGGILTIVLLYGWSTNGGDVSYGRLIGSAEKGFSPENPAYPLPSPMQWWYVLPALVLLVITRLGIPVSTTFLILTFFSPKELGPMLIKSVSGYAVAFVVAIVLYLLIAKLLEKRFHTVALVRNSREEQVWTVLQWLSTGFLWSQWLAQDFANIYVYLPRQLSSLELGGSLVVILLMLAYIFSRRGGAIQKIVTSKTNTTDIRSATIIDFIFGIILLVFKEWSKVPMSTTWVFLGLLAGREYALRYRLFSKIEGKLHKMIASDLGKAALGLLVSVALVYFIRSFT